MLIRIISSIVMLIVTIIVFIFVSLPVFIGLISLLSLLMFVEWSKFIHFKKQRNLYYFWFWAFYTLLVIGPLIFNYIAFEKQVKGIFTDFFITFIIAAVAWLISFIFTIWPNSHHVQRFLTPGLIGLFAIITTKAFLQSLFVLKVYSSYDFTISSATKELINTNYQIPFLLFFVSILVWVTDSFSYFIGKYFGKHKLSPIISPNKTIEGAIGGIIAALIWTLIVIYSPLNQLVPISNPLLFLLLSFITIIFAIQGDLFESLLKRKVGIKDSSNLIPGHGGVLDRVDSLIPAYVIFCLGYFYIFY